MEVCNPAIIHYITVGFPLMPALSSGLLNFDELRKRVLATSGKTRQDVSE